MVSSFAKHFPLFLLISLLLSSCHIHARESHFFSKIPSINNNNNSNVMYKEQATITPQEQQPSFTQETENGYGLYGRDSSSTTATATGEESSSATATASGKESTAATATGNNFPYNEEEIPNKRYLPKNYNPVAYVTVPEDNSDYHHSAAGDTTGNNNFHKKHQSKMPIDAFMESDDTATATANGGVDSYNRPEETYPTGGGGGGAGNGRYNYYNGGGENRVEKQGMSDTRFVENGRYYYPVDNNNYDNAKYDANPYGSNMNFNENNSNFMESSYQSDGDFQDDNDDLP